MKQCEMIAYANYCSIAFHLYSANNIKPWRLHSTSKKSRQSKSYVILFARRKFKETSPRKSPSQKNSSRYRPNLNSSCKISSFNQLATFLNWMTCHFTLPFQFNSCILPVEVLCVYIRRLPCYCWWNLRHRAILASSISISLARIMYTKRP